jgi:hypothetical protein
VELELIDYLAVAFMGFVGFIFLEDISTRIRQMKKYQVNDIGDFLIIKKGDNVSINGEDYVAQYDTTFFFEPKMTLQMTADNEDMD